MYVVLTFNQASSRPEIASEMYADLPAAQAERDELREATAAVGRRERHIVAEVVVLEGELDDQ